MKKELTYIEHHAGTFEEGLQICIHCGHIICDYTGDWLSSSGDAPKGFAEGPIWMQGVNPVQITTIQPLENYGGDDPYTRTIIQCI